MSDDAEASGKKRFVKEQQVGRGTYADVFAGRDLQTGQKIAIKKIKVGQFKDGLDMSAIREVRFLQELHHPNIISMLDVFSSKANLNLVLEFLDSDLEAAIKDKTLTFSSADVKSWMLMMLKGLDFCHRCFVLHRDMKPNNLLIASDGKLKIADFGLARDFGEPQAKMTSQVVTRSALLFRCSLFRSSLPYRWYRPPELLFGARSYGFGVDTWAAGAIFAELMLRLPFMAGESDLDQLTKICQALGTPTTADWPGMTELPDFVDLPKHPKPALREIFTAAPDESLELLQGLLIYDPRKRWSCRDALKSRYFSKAPLASHPSKLPKPKGQLQPRALPPEEGGGPKKRKSEALGDENGENRKVARKLNFE